MSRQADPGQIPGRPGQSVEERRAIHDRVTVAVRTLRAAGVPVEVALVMRGTGLDMHSQASELAEWVASVMEDLADG